MTDPLLTLPESLRDAFKEPLGPVTTDAEALLEAADSAAAGCSTAIRRSPVAASAVSISSRTPSRSAFPSPTATSRTRPASPRW
mgnify:CR=1 FL=1